MSEKDLGEELENIEGEIENLKNKEFKLFGIKMTPMTIGAAFAGLSTVVGALYGGFVMYQKVEEVANLDVGAFEQRMELIEQKVTSVDENIYSIKEDLKGDIRRISDVVDSVERNSKDTMRDVNNDLREFRNDMKALEKSMEDKIQKALDNPLAN